MGKNTPRESFTWKLVSENDDLEEHDEVTSSITSYVIHFRSLNFHDETLLAGVLPM